MSYTECVENDTPSVNSFRLDALGASYDSGSRDVSANATGSTADADAVFYVKLSDMLAVFQFQPPTAGAGADVSLNTAVFDPSSNIRYYVFRKCWPTALKLNPSHAMLDKSESTGLLTGGGGGGGGYSADKSLVKHDFIRYIALQLFQSVHGVDLFQNEEDIRENLAYNGEVARVGIMSVLDTVSSMSADITMAIDGSGNRYATNADTTTTNISRELMCQIAMNAPERFNGSGSGGGSLESVPLIENDTLNLRVVIQTSPNQHALTNVESIPARIYNIKLVMKNTVGSNSGSSGSNTTVSDSLLFPNGYPYASNVYDISASNLSVAASVYADGSPPVLIPSIRYGYQGWYYTNSDAWVNVSPATRNKINWYLLPNTNGATVGDLRYIRLNLRVFNHISVPFLTIYTQATGSGDAGGWYKSKRTFVVSESAGGVSDHTSYCFYINMNGYSVMPIVLGHTNMALSTSWVNGSTVGSFASTETLFAYSVGTDSGSARGNIEFVLSNVVVGEDSGGGGGGGVIEKEYGFIP